MNYRKGELYVELANNCNGKYRCTFETKKNVYVGYTDDAYVWDFFYTDPDRLYWSGSVATLNDSRQLTRDAWRIAYHIAKEGRKRN